MSSYFNKLMPYLNNISDTNILTDKSGLQVEMVCNQHTKTRFFLSLNVYYKYIIKCHMQLI